VRPTPVDHPQVSQSPYASLTGSLDAEETQTLLFKVPAAFKVRLWDVLIAACVVTYARYAQLQPLLILVIHHGRGLTFDGLDLFRTVGNLYTSYPLLLDIDLDLSLETPTQVLKLVAEERMRVPHGGAAWHWVSYHSTEKFIALHDNMQITPNVVFNYLGEMKEDTQAQSQMFREIQKPVGKAPTHLYDVTGKSPHTCETLIEAGRFKVNWEYFSARDEQATIERLIREYLAVLRAMIKAAG
jgi:non-ribosomal peptide synthase protein (TIGR01720 family)